MNKNHLVGQANELLAACLDSDNPDYKLRTSKYNPTSWKVDN